LWVLWEPLSRKQSHGWQWLEYDRSIPENFREGVDPDRNAKPRRGWWSNFWQTNFGWKKVAIFRPVCPVPARSYRLGLISKEGEVRKRQICTCIVEGYCAALVGPDPVEFFAISYPGDDPILIAWVRMTVKSQLGDVPLL